MQSNVATRLAAVVASLILSACSSVLFGVANAPTYFGSLQRAHDAHYGAEDRQVLDVYAQKQTRAAPVVIFWHGGSWATGDKTQYRFVGGTLAKQGFVAVLPNYRLYPEVKFPAFMDDAAAAVAWVQTHAREYGGDPQRVVLMGHSAGAQIASLVAYDSTYLRHAQVDVNTIRGVIGLSGPYALDPNSDQLRTIFAAPYAHANWQPVAHVDANAPPTLILHGRKDTVVSVRHAEKLQAALEQVQVRVESEFYPDANHAATIAPFAWVSPSRLPVVDRCVGFIRSVTGTSADAHAVSARHESDR